jgi:hypothetical protein
MVYDYSSYHTSSPSRWAAMVSHTATRLSILQSLAYHTKSTTKCGKPLAQNVKVNHSYYTS